MGESPPWVRIPLSPPRKENRTRFLWYRLVVKTPKWSSAIGKIQKHGNVSTNYDCHKCGCSSIGRVLAFQASCCEFESRQPLHIFAQRVTNKIKESEKINMHINIGDKFVTVKKAWFIDEGTIINVTNVDKDNIVSFAFDEDDACNGYMDINTFNKHFQKIENTDDSEITEEYITSIMDESEFEVFTSFDKCTIVSCRLPNGFVITEYSACVNPENYDEEVGANICYDKIANKIRELEAYRLHQELYEADIVCCCCEDCCGCPCEECEEEFDECLDTDLDCDDCKDVNCPYRPN